jgi:hypothetical protein
MKIDRDIAAIASKAGLVVARAAGEPENPQDIAKKLTQLLRNDWAEFAELCETLNLTKHAILISESHPEDIIEALRDQKMKTVDFESVYAISAEGVKSLRGEHGSAVFFVKLGSSIKNAQDLVKALADKYRDGSAKVRNYVEQSLGISES